MIRFVNAIIAIIVFSMSQWMNQSTELEHRSQRFRGCKCFCRATEEC